jgi:hypothetical protein
LPIYRGRGIMLILKVRKMKKSFLRMRI